MGAGFAREAETWPPVPIGPAAADTPPIISFCLAITGFPKLTSNGHITSSRERLDSFIRVEDDNHFGQI